MNMRYGVRLIICLMVLAALAGVAGTVGPVQAAPHAQQKLQFDARQPSVGSLGGGVATVTYGFDCVEGGVGSVTAETTSGDLAVDMAVMDARGNTFATGTLASRDPNVTVAEAFGMPADGPCTVTLTRSGNTSGEYAVRLLHGFAQLDVWDAFDGSGDPLSLTWTPYASANMTVAPRNQELRIEVTTDNLFAYAIPDETLTWSDVYLQADFRIEGTPSYAEYGFALRINDDSSAFYTVTFSTDGDYSVYYLDNDTWTAVAEWTVSPLVDATATNIRAAVSLQDNVFRLYWGDRFVAEVTDTNRFASEGQVALAAATTVDQTDTLTMYADNFVVTSPYPVTGGLPFNGVDASQITPTSPGAGLMSLFGATPTPAPAQPTPTSPALFVPTATPAQSSSVYPQTLSLWSATEPRKIVGELAQLGLVPDSGSQVVNVPSSYGDTSSSGFSFFPLGQGSSYRNFALGFDARLVYSGAGAGCGMYFRDNAQTSHSAMVFEDGWALLGQWDADGKLTDVSSLEAFSGVTAGQDQTNRVLVVAVDDTVLMYVNGQFFASGSFAAQTGSIALEMYVPADDSGATVESYCQLNNIWLWQY